MRPQVLIIKSATGALTAPILLISPTRKFCLLVRLVMVALLVQVLMVRGLARHNLVVIRGRGSLIALCPPLVAHIVAPVSIPVVPAGRRVSGLLPAMVLQDKLVLDRRLEPIVFNGFATGLLQRISDVACLLRSPS